MDSNQLSPEGIARIQGIQLEQVDDKSRVHSEKFKVGVNTWSIMHKFFKLLWIVNIHQKAEAWSSNRIIKGNVQGGSDFIYFSSICTW